MRLLGLTCVPHLVLSQGVNWPAGTPEYAGLDADRMPSLPYPAAQVSNLHNNDHRLQMGQLDGQHFAGFQGETNYVSNLGSGGVPSSASLLAQLDAKDKAAIRLAAENRAYKDELDRWRGAGQHIAVQEKRILDLLTKEQDGTVFLQPSVSGADTGELYSAHWFAQMVPYQAVLLVAVAIFAFRWRDSLLICFAGSKETTPLNPGHRNSLQPGNSGLSAALSAAGRCFGCRYETVEFSELQITTIGNSIRAGKVYLVIEAAGNSEKRTKTVQLVANEPNHFIRFNQTIRVNVRQFGGQCSISIYEAAEEEGSWDTCLASCDLAASDVLDYAMQTRDYYSFDLMQVTEAQGSKKSVKKFVRLAVCIRNSKSSASTA